MRLPLQVSRFVDVPGRPLPPLPDPYGPERPEPDDEGDGEEPRHSPDPLTVDDEPTSDPFEHVDLLRGWGITLDDPTRWHPCLCLSDGQGAFSPSSAACQVVS